MLDTLCNVSVNYARAVMQTVGERGSPLVQCCLLKVVLSLLQKPGKVAESLVLA